MGRPRRRRRQRGPRSPGRRRRGDRQQRGRRRRHGPGARARLRGRRPQTSAPIRTPEEAVTLTSLDRLLAPAIEIAERFQQRWGPFERHRADRKSTRLNSSHVKISYAVFCLKKKNKHYIYFLLHRIKKVRKRNNNNNIIDNYRKL